MPLALWIGYVFFVVYGSLVPLQFNALPLADAWRAFQNIPYLQLGIASRADWVANGVLYVPLGFLSVFLLKAALPRAWAAPMQVLAALFCLALAVGVEFTQLFFPPRTVSLNDVMAEAIGSLIGVALGAKFGRWFAAFLRSFLTDTRRLFVLGLDAYVVVYLVFALFPFDFLLSWDEIADKVNSDLWGWLVAGAGAQKPVTVLIKGIAEAALTVPFGVLLARLAGARQPGYALAAFIGLLLGGCVEVAQFFVGSGVSQGLSVLTRIAGVCAGLALVRYATRHARLMSSVDAARLARRVGPYLAVPYLVVLLQINGWITPRWHGLQAAKRQLAEVNFLPFYYHYFTTEAIALFSLAAVTLSYLPVGGLAWAYGRSAGVAAGLAILLAGGVETGKLFIVGAHPDPTNMLIAGVAVWITVSILQLFERGKRPAAGLATDPGAPSAWRPAAPGPLRLKIPAESRLPGQLSWLGLALCTALVTAWLMAFPTLRLLVAVVLGASCVAVWRQPRLAFAILPAALPVFDLAPWSGRFFFDEFDVLVLLLLAVAYARAPRPAAAPGSGGHRQARRLRTPGDLFLLFSVALLALSFAISTVRGLLPFTLPASLPFAWPDANAFNNYFSNFNALRVAKGALWALLLWRLSRRFLTTGVRRGVTRGVTTGTDVRRYFSWGMTAGLALTVVWILWERAAFPGLLDFTQDYRVTGPFSVTHTGGAYIDCFLAAAIPFLLVQTIEQRRWVFKLAGVVLVLASTYALVLTYSRGGYLAFAVAVAVLLLAMLSKSVVGQRGSQKSQGLKRYRDGLILGGLGLAMLLVALPVFKSGFMQSRLATVGADFDVRKAHWADALAIRDPGLLTALFGMGVGQFPQTKYWRSTLHPKIATYRLLTEQPGGKTNTFLRLDAGEPIGVEQFVAMAPGQNYVLKFDVRPSHANTQVVVPICEKWLLTSARCLTPSIDLGAQKGVWRSVELTVDSQALAPAHGPVARPIKLSLGHSMAQSTLDIDNLRLLSPNQVDLLSNGDFSNGLDHWYFSIAGTLHAHWRTHSLPVGVLFDQGWLGLVAWVLVLAVAMGRAGKNAWAGDTFAAAALAALAGYLVGALFDTQVDAPRFLLLLLLLTCMACTRPTDLPTTKRAKFLA